MDFSGKVVLVTGASAGIGAATSELFAARGARLALVGRNESNLRATAARCAQKHAPLAIVADLTTDAGCDRVAKETLDHFGRLDVLVNNAGVGARADLARADMATFDAMFAVNVRGVFNLTRLLAPALIQAKGNIVNVSSVAATRVAVGSLPYGMAKAALDHFSRLIALELAPKGVRVNTISPGITITNFVKRITGCRDEEYKAWLQKAAADNPMGCINSAEEVAKLIVFVSSEEAGLVTGTTIQAARGYHLGTSDNVSLL